MRSRLAGSRSAWRGSASPPGNPPGAVPRSGSGTGRHGSSRPGSIEESNGRATRRTPRLTTCFDDLAAAIRAWAKGWLPAEAAAELLVAHQGWLLREDFLQVAVEAGWEPFRDREIAAVDFAAAAEAVQGVLPCSDGERQVLLVAASIAAGIPVDLREAALCMDAVNAARAARAICHAAGCRVPVVTETCR